MESKKFKHENWLKISPPKFTPFSLPEVFVSPSYSPKEYKLYNFKFLPPRLQGIIPLTEMDTTFKIDDYPFSDELRTILGEKYDQFNPLFIGTSEKYIFGNIIYMNLINDMFESDVCNAYPSLDTSISILRYILYQFNEELDANEFYYRYKQVITDLEEVEEDPDHMLDLRKQVYIGLRTHDFIIPKLELFESLDLDELSVDLPDRLNLFVFHYLNHFYNLYTIECHNNRIKVSNILYDRIRNLISNKCRFILINIDIKILDDYHSNIVIIDKFNKTVERFEPYGYADYDLSSIIEDKYVDPKHKKIVDSIFSGTTREKLKIIHNDPEFKKFLNTYIHDNHPYLPEYENERLDFAQINSVIDKYMSTTFIDKINRFSKDKYTYYSPLDYQDKNGPQVYFDCPNIPNSLCKSYAYLYPIFRLANPNLNIIELNADLNNLIFRYLNREYPPDEPVSQNDKKEFVSENIYRLINDLVKNYGSKIIDTLNSELNTTIVKADFRKLII